jgi:PBP1b-binding outer membrane lipoprotein LpoB
MRPLPLGALLTIIVMIILIALFLVGCQSPKAQANGIDASVVRQAASVDQARLNVSDGSLYQPAFRILEDERGRLRLISQDPITHHYVLVR